MIHGELPVQEHKLLLQSRNNQIQQTYALNTVPKVLSKMILGWAETYVERGGAFGEYMLDDLITRVQSEWYIEELCYKHGVAEKFIEQAVAKTKLLCLGAAA